MYEKRAESLVRKLLLVSFAMIICVSPSLAAYDGLYVLDVNGNIHVVDGAPVITNGVNFGYNIARDIEVTGNETGTVNGTYLLTGGGDVWAFGAAPVYSGMTTPFYGWDVARDLEVAVDWSVRNNGQAGYYILDAFGGIFPVGDLTRPYFKVYRTVSGLTSPGDDRYLYWGWDIAIDLEVAPLYDLSDSNLQIDGYYVLDKYGGVHWCIEDQKGNVIRAPWMGQGKGQPYFGRNFARDFELTRTAKGYFLLDGNGFIYVIGDASLPSGAQQNPFGWDIAEDMELCYDETTYDLQGIAVMTRTGLLREIGTVGIQVPLPEFVDGTGLAWEIAEDMELSPMFAVVTGVVTGP